jgi:shikimate dehydrogenase
MIQPQPTPLEGHGIRLEPLTLDHHEALAAAAADGRLWELWFTSVPAPETVPACIREKTGVAAITIGEEMLREYAADADCLINATPLGLKKTDPLPIRAESIQRKHLVCDLVYNPPETALLKTAKKRGAKRQPGLGMLLYQGVIAFEIWTGKTAPVMVMKNALSRQIR